MSQKILFENNIGLGIRKSMGQSGLQRLQLLFNFFAMIVIAALLMYLAGES